MFADVYHDFSMDFNGTQAFHDQVAIQDAHSFAQRIEFFDKQMEIVLMLLGGQVHVDLTLDGSSDTQVFSMLDEKTELDHNGYSSSFWATWNPTDDTQITQIFDSQNQAWEMRLIITDWDTGIEKKFVQKWKLGKRVCSQSIKVDSILIWEDSFDTQGTVFDTESEKGSGNFDHQVNSRYLMN